MQRQLNSYSITGSSIASDTGNNNSQQPKDDTMEEAVPVQNPFAEQPEMDHISLTGM